MSDTEENTETTTDNFLGRVKWFNNKSGYGFVTILDGEKKGEDVFAHHSGVNVDSEQYKYLVQGEYVTFILKESDNTEHPFQADNITGICGGKLMCETRNEQRQQRDDQEVDNDRRRPQQTDRRGGYSDRRSHAPRANGRNQQRFRLHGGGPRGDRDRDGDGGGVWTLVREDEQQQRPRRPHRDSRNRDRDQA